MPQQAEFDKLVRQRSSELQKLLDDWSKGRLDIDELGEEYYEILRQGHTDAYVLGAKQSGSRLDPLALQTLAEQFGRQQADAEDEFLNGFLSDLEDGRYTDDEGNADLSKIDNRARMYGHKMRATANVAFVEESPNDSEFDWVMSGLEAHCEDCPRMAALSPYTADELFTYPGAGDTQCVTGCKCYLKRSDGVTGLKRPA